MAEQHTTNYDVKVEVRSLNGKYLDMNFRMPRYLLSKELDFRKLLGEKVERGSVTVNIHVVRHEVDQDMVRINTPLATAYYSKLKGLSQQLDAPDHDIFRITSLMQDVIYMNEEGISDELVDLVSKTMVQAFEQFDAFRLTEGEHIRQHLSECNENIAAYLPQIEELEHERTEQTRERIHKNLLSMLDDENYDKNRFEQELIYYIEKFDISEEKKRLRAHCTHFAEALEKSPKGKKLNFIAQEMGREINTLGSKANHAGIQKCVIGMKEELEKIKEQALNVL